MSINLDTLTKELLNTSGVGMTPPSEQDESFSLNEAYQVATRLLHAEQREGHRLIGRKIGISNPALWDKLGLDNVVWGYMTDRTVQRAKANEHTVSLARMNAPKLEPEIIFKLRAEPPLTHDPEALLEAAEWVALGAEIVDNPYPEWRFKPADLVATFGFHAALVIGTPMAIEQTPAARRELAQALATCQLKLFKNGEAIAEGSGQNVVGNPATALGHLAEVIEQHAQVMSLGSDEIITTGTLTGAHEVGAGDQLTLELSGLPLAGLTLEFSK